MNTTTLPAHYRLMRTIDLQRDKKLMIAVNLLSLAIFFLLLFVGTLLQPISIQLESLGVELGRMLALLGAVAVYIFAHEGIHGVMIRIYGGVKPQYGFTGLFAYAGSDQAYFDRSSYLVIALAPVLVWGVVLGLLPLFLPAGWFWPVYLIQCFNLSGAAGDLFVSVLLLRMPRNLLVQDTGLTMTVFCPQSAGPDLPGDRL